MSGEDRRAHERWCLSPSPRSPTTRNRARCAPPPAAASGERCAVQPGPEPAHRMRNLRRDTLHAFAVARIGHAFTPARDAATADRGDDDLGRAFAPREIVKPPAMGQRCGHTETVRPSQAKCFHEGACSRLGRACQDKAARRARRLPSVRAGDRFARGKRDGVQLRLERQLMEPNRA